MTWVLIGALAAAAFAVAAFVLKLGRSGWTLLAAALFFGLAGYGLQGSPDRPADPRTAETQEDGGQGELIVAARRRMLGDDGAQPAHMIVADAFARRGAWSDSAAYLQAHLDRYPRDGEAWLAYAIALTAQGGGQLAPAAQLAFARAQEFLPNRVAPAFFQGAALVEGGGLGEGLDLWQSALEQSDDDDPGAAELAERTELLREIVQGQSAPAAQPET